MKNLDIHSQKQQLTEVNRKEYLLMGIKHNKSKQIFLQGEQQAVILNIDEKGEVILAAFYQQTEKRSLVEGRATYYTIEQ